MLLTSLIVVMLLLLNNNNTVTSLTLHTSIERVRSREITIGHVPDRSMPADFLTKWIGASKLNVSVEHVTNRRHAPMQPEAI